ncbi:MAG TPA: penicillin-binding transpeptidase domain-containing protein [Solirubrobacteraceae bacterium]|jgi:peptidoglycan glycosyltransferase|nr:penicillin-binding transpeptidase domain-containing protein [Solirubrobacteraceae bacterium]
MNAQIVKLFGLVVVLFALLITWTTRWAVIDATALNHNPLNSRTIITQLRIKRGRILAGNGVVLAKPIPKGHREWGRAYPQGPLYAQTVGYWTGQSGNAAGLEVSANKYLTPTQTGLNSVFGPLGGNQTIGNDLYTTLDPKAQQVAEQGLAGRVGSVVALDPRTGAVLAMYSNPSYNPNHPNAPCSDSCQLDRATQGQYPPGSTFKIVTTTAAINSGKFTPNSIINGDSPKLISGVPLQNDYNQSFGPITFTKALTYSVNTVFAQVAQDVGRKTMTQYMKRFGFYSRPPIDLPADEVYPSIVVSPSGKPFSPGSPNEDIGRIGFGQGGLAVTPLQMAMVAAAVAHGGKLMTPHLVDRVVDQTGRTVHTIQPTVYRNVMTPATASEITLMMRAVVDEGTGTPAQLGNNIPFAGKTGTASKGPAGSNETQPWFIGFAPANAPKVAVAVTIETTNGQFGGQVAAPIAKNVVQTLLSEGK